MSTKATGIFLWQKIQVILARQEKTEESTEQNNKVFQDTELFLCKQGEKLLFHSQHIEHLSETALCKHNLSARGYTATLPGAESVLSFCQSYGVMPVNSFSKKLKAEFVTLLQ